MITRETCQLIWNAYREIETGEKLLADMKEVRERKHLDRHAPTLKDAFGKARHLRLGVPMGDDSRQLFEVSPVLAESIIRSHIEKKRAELVDANERARVELDTT